MPLILAILTFAVFIGISYVAELMKRRSLSVAAPEGSEFSQPVVERNANAEPVDLPPVAALPGSGKDTARVEGYALPESLYYHQGHTWVALQDSGLAIVGVDDFAGKLLGAPTSIKLPRVGQTCRQGATALTLNRRQKALTMLSPLDGQIVAVNDRVFDDPSVIMHEPYSNGWLMMVKPRELKRNLRNLISGTIARSWMEESAVTLRSIFSGDLGLVFQDGGMPEEGLADYIKFKEWRDIANRIFMIEPDNSGLQM